MKRILLITALALLAFSKTTLADSITITVQNIKSSGGKISCSLYNQPKGFPTKGAKVAHQRLNADSKGVTCHFDELAPGTYAATVLHDLNDNKKMDKNFFGIPSEDWGITNNIRPNMRAPTFDEAKFELKTSINMEVKIDS